MAESATQDTTTTTTTATVVEDRAAQTVATNSTGGLQVEDRVTVTRQQPRGLAEEFRAAGFPGETATIDFDTFEDRAVTWTGSVDNINKATNTAGGLGAGIRYAWPAFSRVNVDADATSVDVFTQTARTLPSAATVVRAIDAVTAKPEVASTLTIVTTSLKQVAAIYTNVPNIQLEQAAFNSVIETDLRLAINEGLDKLVLDFIATAGFQAPSTDPLLVSIRKAMTTIMGNGYNPDTLLLTPANAEAFDVLVSGITGGTNDYVFAPANFAPNQVFGLNKRISKTVPAAAVVDSQALGKLYTSPVDARAVRGRRRHHQPRQRPHGAQRRLRRRAHRRGRPHRGRLMRERKPNRKTKGDASARRPKSKTKPKDTPPDVSRVSRVRATDRGGRRR